jgi:hypothetical protein
MADRPCARQPRHDFGIAVIIADQTQTLMRVEPDPVMGNDAGCFLAAMLQRMQPQSCNSGGIRDVPNTENATFFMRPVIIDQI